MGEEIEPAPSIPGHALEWYTLAQLGQLWGMQKRSVGNWLTKARQRGHGPTPEQVWYIWAGPRADRIYLRGDYCVALHAWSTRHHIRAEIAARQFRRRAPQEGRPPSTRGKRA